MATVYVGNVSYATTEDDLRALFFQFGNVERVTIVTDRETGQPRGFAFVEMMSVEDAQNAISLLNGTRLHGRTLTVNEGRAKPAGRARRAAGGQGQIGGRY